MNKLFIKEKYLKELIEIFNGYCPKAVIYAYGSRLNGDAHEGSDLDLTVKDFGNSNCNLAELKNLLTGSNIPFLVDISEFDSLPDYFQEEIIKDFVTIYPAE